MADDKIRKPKNYYVDYSKNSKYGRSQNHRQSSSGGGNLRYSETADIAPGQKGFLVTSITGYEVKCYLEIRQFLEDYYQELYPDDTKQGQTEPASAKDASDSKEAPKISSDGDDLEQELAELRKAKRHFRQVKTHCKNVVFIVMNDECKHVDQNLVVRKIFEDIEKSKIQKTRYTFKMFPIMTTFTTSVSDAKEAVANILKESFSDQSNSKEDTRYFIEIQIRGNFKFDSAKRMKMIEGLADTVTEIKPSWKVDRDNADLILLVVALREVCCITFIADYFKLQKYNIVEYYRKHLGEFDDLTGAPAPLPGSGELSGQEAQ